MRRGAPGTARRCISFNPGPGSTVTEFQWVGGEPHRLHYHTEAATKVARVGLGALARGRSYAISGFANYLSAGKAVPIQLKSLENQCPRTSPKEGF